MSKVRKTTDARFEFDVLRAAGPVLVDFYADWCRTCHRLDPQLEELAEAWRDELPVFKVDVERNHAVTERYGIRGLPTLILFDGGDERVRMVEVVRRAAIEERIAAALPESARGGT